MVTLLMLICLILPFGQSPQTMAPNEIGFKPLQERYSRIQDIQPVIKNSGDHSIFLSSRYSKAFLRRFNEATGELEDCGGFIATCGAAAFNDPPVEIKPGGELPVEVSASISQDGQPCCKPFGSIINGLRSGTDSSKNSQKLPEPASTTSTKWKYKLIIHWYGESWEMGTLPPERRTVESDWFQFGDE